MCVDAPTTCASRVLLGLVLVLALAPSADSRAQTGALVRDSVSSPALAGNLLGDATRRSVIVYLPPSYATAPRRRYPVVFVLHGVGDSNADWINGQFQGLNIATALDSLIAAGAVREMIVVLPDARNAHDGSFYTNSPVTGNWEDFITRDVLRHIDKTYRTLRHASGRAIVGHSMGGYGALRFAMKHPKLFGAVYALSPCCLEWTADFSERNPHWPATIALRVIDQKAEQAFYPKLFISIATAWSPNPRRPPFKADLPFQLIGTEVRPAEPAHSYWTANLILPMAERRRSNLARLRAIGLDYGTMDQFPHIVIGSRSFSRFLTEHGIDHQAQAYDGDHFNRVRERLTAHALPFLSRALAAAVP